MFTLFLISFFTSVVKRTRWFPGIPGQGGCAQPSHGPATVPSAPGPLDIPAESHLSSYSGLEGQAAWGTRVANQS